MRPVVEGRSGRLSAVQDGVLTSLAELLRSIQSHRGSAPVSHSPMPQQWSNERQPETAHNYPGQINWCPVRRPGSGFLHRTGLSRPVQTARSGHGPAFGTCLSSFLSGSRPVHRSSNRWPELCPTDCRFCVGLSEPPGRSDTPGWSLPVQDACSAPTGRQWVTTAGGMRHERQAAEHRVLHSGETSDGVSSGVRRNHVLAAGSSSDPRFRTSHRSSTRCIRIGNTGRGTFGSHTPLSSVDISCT